MCGIFGYAGTPTDAAAMVFGALKHLDYRGYDSWGIAVGASNAVHTAREVGKLTTQPTGLPQAGIALGHTRWATTGRVTVENAHPHCDCTGRLAVVHNGIIENHALLRAEMVAAGHRLLSQTDSEVAAHLIEDELAALAPGQGSLVEALRRVGRRLEGCNTIAVLDAASGELAASRNGSPLVVGLSGGASYLASDMAALLQFTQRLVWIEDQQVVSLQAGTISLFDAATGRTMPINVEQIGWCPEQAALGGFQHFLQKEIREQPMLLRRIAAEGMEQATALGSFLSAGRQLHLVGCGTAYHAALAGRYLIARAGYPAFVSHAHEFGAIAAQLKPGDRVLAFSQSGETIDVLDAVRAARHAGTPVAALINVPGSTLAREVNLPLMLGAGPEKAVLSTKTFMAKIAYLMLGVGVMQGTPECASSMLCEAADEIEQSLTGQGLAAIRELARTIAPHDHLFILGRGLGYVLAVEAALKIKEATYIHAEGFPAGELKHGVIALIEPGTPVIIFAPPGADEAHLLSSASEVQARGAFVIGVGPRHHDLFDVHLPVPSGDLAYVLESLTLMQQLAYELALLRGTDPDKPRNLAKSVTVR